jgi:hypothetical protein
MNNKLKKKDYFNMSKLITIKDVVDKHIITKGFYPVLAEAFFINAKLSYDVFSFLNAYEELEVDSYVLKEFNVPYRKRKYGSYIYDSIKNELIKNEHSSFLQNEKVNKLFGGIERNFAAIDIHILENKFLQELIKADFSKFPEEDKELSKKWFVGVQMFRVEASKDFIGQPTPEGIHQDDHHFVVQHMIRKKNVTGGVSTIYTLEQEEIISLTLNDFLDSCYVKDEKVMHSVTGIECINENELAVRDMLILDFKLLD